MSAKNEKRRRQLLRLVGVPKKVEREIDDFNALVARRRAEIEAKLDDAMPAARQARRVALAWVALVVLAALTVLAVGGLQ